MQFCCLVVSLLAHLQGTCVTDFYFYFLIVLFYLCFLLFVSASNFAILDNYCIVFRKFCLLNSKVCVAWENVLWFLLIRLTFIKIWFVGICILFYSAEQICERFFKKSLPLLTIKMFLFPLSIHFHEGVICHKAQIIWKFTGVNPSVKMISSLQASIFPVSFKSALITPLLNKKELIINLFLIFLSSAKYLKKCS